MLVAAAVRLTMGRPVFFGQVRIGVGGEPFRLTKFRTMTLGEEGSAVTAGGDARITSLGRVLRSLKLDELPQLWNVVRGEMSLVGPRPEVPRFVELEDPVWREVLRYRPGITDPVSLRLRNEEALLAEVEGDVEAFYREQLLPYKLRLATDYLSRRTPVSDLGVLLRTAFAVLLRDATPPPTLAEIQAAQGSPSPTHFSF